MGSHSRCCKLGVNYLVKFLIFAIIRAEKFCCTVDNFFMFLADVYLHQIMEPYTTTAYSTISLDLVQVRLRRKLGRDGLETFAAFRMLLAKIGAKICCSSQLANHASVGKIRM